MSDSWLSPKLLEKIANNVPFLQRALLALVKQDPSSIADVPAGAKRLTEISKGMWQLQQFNGTSWEPLGKLQMDVDTLDTFHAALTPQKSTIPVRDANGDLPGNITGNAATADSAKTLSEILEVEKGGTGASTSEQARRNLGAAPTSHASSSADYGLATDSQYGHIRSDGKTTKIMGGQVIATDIAVGGDSSDPASGRGQIGDTPWIRQAVIDFNTYTRSGAWWVTWDDEALNAPETDAGVNGLLVVYAAKGLEGTVVRQFFYRWGTAGTTDKHMWTRSISSNVTEWGPWYLINNSSITIIDVDSQSDNTSVVGMPFGIYGKGVDGVKRILFPFRFVPGKEFGNGLVIDTGGLVIIGSGESGRNVAAGLVSEGSSGEKETLYLASDSSIDILFGQNNGYDPSKYFRIDANGRMYLSADDPDIVLRCLGLEKGQIPESEIFNVLAFSDKIGNGNASHFSIVESAVRKNGDVDIKLAVFPNEAGNSVFSSMGIKMRKDKTSYSWCPTPKSDSNTNHIATTEWVRARHTEWEARHTISTDVPTASQGTDGDIWYRY